MTNYNLSMKNAEVQGFKELGKIGVASILTEWHPMSKVFAHAFSLTVGANLIYIESNGTVVTNSFKDKTVKCNRALFNANVAEIVSNVIKRIKSSNVPTVLYFDNLDLFPESVDSIISDFLKIKNRSNVWTFVTGNEQTSALRLYDNEAKEADIQYYMA